MSLQQLKNKFNSKEIDTFLATQDNWELGGKLSKLIDSYKASETQGGFCEGCIPSSLSNFIVPGTTKESLSNISDVERIAQDPKRQTEKMKQLFIGYCGRCHLADIGSPLPLPLEEPAKLSNYKMTFQNFDNGEGVLGRLDRREMPPSSSSEYKMLHSGDFGTTNDFKEMKEYLENLK